MAFIDIEEALCEYLEDIADTVTYTQNFGEVPDTVLPLIRINRTNGSANTQAWEDNPIVEIQCFATSRAASQLLTSQVRAKMAGKSYVQTSVGLIDTIVESIAPNEIPYGEEYLDERRTFSSWALSTRSQ